MDGVVPCASRPHHIHITSHHSRASVVASHHQTSLSDNVDQALSLTTGSQQNPQQTHHHNDLFCNACMFFKVAENAKLWIESTNFFVSFIDPFSGRNTLQGKIFDHLFDTNFCCPLFSACPSQHTGLLVTLSDNLFFCL